MWKDLSFCAPDITIENGELLGLVHMTWKGKPREKAAWLNLDSGDVRLESEGEFWCDDPLFCLPSKAPSTTKGTGVGWAIDDNYCYVPEKPPPNMFIESGSLDEIYQMVRKAREQYLDAEWPQETVRPSTKPRF